MPKDKLKKLKLTKEEKAVETALIKGEYVSVSKKEYDLIKKSLAVCKKDNR